MEKLRHPGVACGRRNALRWLVPGLALALIPSAALAAKIYKCRAYAGGSYWSATPCDTRQAASESVYDVPDGLTFKQQVELVEPPKKKPKASPSAEERESERKRKCAEIEREIKQIDSRYASGRYVPADQVNADQARMRDLKALRSRNRCYE